MFEGLIEDKDMTILMQKAKFKEHEYTVLTHGTRLERLAKRMWTDCYVSLLVNGQRRIGIVQPTHFKFLDYRIWHEWPNMEIEVKGWTSGRIKKAQVKRDKIEFHETLDDAKRSCNEHYRKLKERKYG